MLEGKKKVFYYFKNQGFGWKSKLESMVLLDDGTEYAVSNFGEFGSDHVIHK